MLKLKHSLLCLLLMANALFAYSETIYVTNTNSDGTGSLKQAILDANSDVSATTIVFEIPGSGDHVILTSPQLPAITSPVIITTSGNQSGRTVLKAPVITGPGAPTGLTFATGSAGSVVQFVTFSDYVFSIVIETANIGVFNNSFENNQGGADVRLVNGSIALIKGNTFTTTHTAYGILGNSSGGSAILGNTFDGAGIAIQNSGGLYIGGANSGDPNTFTNISGIAIDLYNVNGSSIYGNTINGASVNGVKVTGVDNIIAHNTISQVAGYDIVLEGGYYNHIYNNIVTGDNGIFNGVLLKDGYSHEVYNNVVDGGAIELDNVSSAIYGLVKVNNNIVTNDPNGFSGHGAISLTNVSTAIVTGNEIHHNGGQGIFLFESSYVDVINNEIYENGRVSIYVVNGDNNKLSKNLIYDNHADAMGGRTGIFLANANNGKAAPVITSAKKVGANFVIEGTGTTVYDTVEIFLSDAISNLYALTQNAKAYVASVAAFGNSWTATVPAANYTGEVYFIATSTAGRNTSMFSNVKAVQINGPTAATTNHSSYYYTENLPGASYSWWTSLPYTSMQQSGNSVYFNFMQPGSGYVSVGYTHPTTGQWVMHQLQVTVYGPARYEINEAGYENEALAYPNPFVSTATIQLNPYAQEASVINVFSMNGELVESIEGVMAEEVEIGAGLEPGVYNVQIVEGKEIKNIKIVKK
ncbi:MAG TPA: right-handed parallel beta-helix repeat-containing protein [Cytophagaceae bacterium]